jgi:hypothetical protein
MNEQIIAHITASIANRVKRWRRLTNASGGPNAACTCMRSCLYELAPVRECKPAPLVSILPGLTRRPPRLAGMRLGEFQVQEKRATQNLAGKKSAVKAHK